MENDTKILAKFLFNMPYGFVNFSWHENTWDTIYI